MSTSSKVTQPCHHRDRHSMINFSPRTPRSSTQTSTPAHPPTNVPTLEQTPCPGVIDTYCLLTVITITVSSHSNYRPKGRRKPFKLNLALGYTPSMSWPDILWSILSLPVTLSPTLLSQYHSSNHLYPPACTVGISLASLVCSPAHDTQASNGPHCQRGQNLL